MLNNFVDKIKLPFRKDKELYLSLYDIIGCYPHNISYYKLALMHKSVARRTEKGKPANNERLEFLGDAILDAIVGDIVYQHFPGKREGFLTNTRSKIVQRDTLNRLAKEMGINRLILSSGRSSSHNSYLGGNAFEALVGALYLDRGYEACRRFMEQRILGELINIDKVAYKEVNFKSKLIEWSQKNRAEIDFDMLDEKSDENGSPMFHFRVLVEGIEGGDGKGYSKKESQQIAAKATLQRLRKEKKFLDKVLEAKRVRMEAEEKAGSGASEDAGAQEAEATGAAAIVVGMDTKKPAQASGNVETMPKTDVEVALKEPEQTEIKVENKSKVDLKALILEDSKRAAENRKRRQQAATVGIGTDFDLSDISLSSASVLKENIIAAAEAKAFGGE